MMKIITVPQNVKDAFNPVGARYIEWAVRFEIINEEAVAEMVPSSTEDTLISRIEQTKDYKTDALNIQTYEYMGFPLDGSGFVPPRRGEASGAQIGLIRKDLSDGDGHFQTPQTYMGTMEHKFNLIGITLNWGHTIAADFQVEWYSSGTRVHVETVTGNTEERNLISAAVLNVDKVVITVIRTLLPYRRVRIAECLLGAVMVYDKSNSDSMSLDETSDPLNERITANKMTLVTDNFANQFNIFDPSGIYSYFRNRMKMNAKIGAKLSDGSVHFIDMGQYYLKAPSLKGNLAKLQLETTDIMGILQDTIYTKGVYKTASFAQFVNDVALDADVTCIYPSGFSGTSMPAYLGSMPHAQAFRLIAQATNTFVQADRQGRVVFQELGNVPQQTIGKEDYLMNNGFSPADDDIVNTVSLKYANLTVESVLSELTSINVSGTLTNSVFYADNAVITTTAGIYYVNYEPATEQTAAISGGKLTVKGKKILNNAGTIVVTNKQENEPSYVYEMDGNVFLQASNASGVANYMLERKAQKRRTVKISYRGYPYLEMGDIIDFDAGGEMKTQSFLITKNSLKLGGGMTGTLETRER